MGRTRLGISLSALVCVCLVLLLMTGCGCEHSSWENADCTEPARCADCGMADGLPLGHSWLDADCTTPQTCELCGDTKGEARGHNWKEADSDFPKTCKRCGVTEGEPLTPEAESRNFDQVYEDICFRISGEFDKAEFEYDDAVCILYVSIAAKKGTAESIVLNPDKVTEYWAEVSASIISLSKAVAEDFRSAGFKVDCCIMLISDANRDNLLLAAQNGKIIFDVIE